ncbi:malto-oligosyltrehalose synthase [Streptomyces sp. HNM0574]|uniref:malto-oligosyltrehalose synthase n=1 Tax=Streptomyces sp. HNM0574 TaxID=2714954 RepID=UPI00146DB47E|nr:malto-oligosyltrehalose synthase [Streptomyces sp. HNM0574]NLU65851.1 malto-oligosyltrehalose synthase [Streptomyces sp. HNM0574]
MTPTPPPVPPRPRTPRSTYRLQLRPDFPFAAAEEALPHIAALGVSHLHLSPVLTSVPGSPHGYDVTDHSSVRAELGGEDGLRALAAAAHARGLGLVLDIVPNHMAVPADTRLNHQLWEVLREGPQSRYAHWFDVDWAAQDGRLLLPVLAGPVHEELPRLRTGDGTLHYGDRTFPLRPGTGGLPLPELLAAQHYRLAWWRLARTEVNYRRFFTVHELIGVRVEEPDVFDAVHGKVLHLLHEGVLDGLRIDHPDGLADPGGYVRRLHKATDGRWTVLEKILGRHETLPAGWPVAGTTGYDTLHRVDGLFTDPVGHAGLTAVYQHATRAEPLSGGEWEPTERHAAAQVAAHDLAAETARLARAAAACCAAAPELALRDHTYAALHTALHRVLVRLPVYRPYVVPGAPVDEADRALLESAAEGARADCGAPDEAAAVDVVLGLALGRFGEGPHRDDFARRFGQVSSALRAKAVEDRAFYRWAPLLSACEVGGSPGEPAVSPAEFHAHCLHVARDHPATGTVLSTHDTKRSADVRAALMVLSECPERWAGIVAGVRAADGGSVDDPPDRHTEWAALQTAFALHAVDEPGPPDPARWKDALLKSVREAGLRTTWTEPDMAYEEAVAHYAETVARRAAPGQDDPTARALAGAARQLAPHVRANVLGQTLLHLTVPGVPDVYQGTERLYAALVDPDNRRPVAFGAPARPGLDSEKLGLTRTALGLRRAHPEWFTEHATYEPLTAEGEAAGHCVAFVRGGRAITAVTRLGLRLREAGGWGRTELRLPEGSWHDLLSRRTVEGGRCPLSGLLTEDAPVALLVRA